MTDDALLFECRYASQWKWSNLWKSISKL